MLVTTLHSGIKMDVQRKSSSEHLFLEHEGIDVYINDAIHKYISSLLPIASVSNKATDEYSKVRRLYDELGFLIKRQTIFGGDMVYHAIEFDVESRILSNNIIVDGLIEHSKTYIIYVVGSVDFTVYGASSNTVSTSFICNLPVISGGGGIIQGNEYMILKPETFDFTAIGSVNNDIGTVFTATSNVTLPEGNTSVQTTKLLPAWDGTSALIVDGKPNRYLEVTGHVGTRNLYNSGELKSGVMYNVITKGTTDLSGFGQSATSQYNTFVCTTTGTPTWDGTTTLRELRDIRISINTLENAIGRLHHAYGITHNSTVCTFRTIDKLKKLTVYTANKFMVYAITVEYMIQQGLVNYANNTVGGISDLVLNNIKPIVIADMVNNNNKQQ